MGSLKDIKFNNLLNMITDTKKRDSLSGSDRDAYSQQRTLFAMMMKSKSKESMEENFAELMSFSLREKYRGMYPELTEQELDSLKFDEMASEAKSGLNFSEENKQPDIVIDEKNPSKQCDDMLNAWMDQINKSLSSESKEAIEKLDKINKERQAAKEQEKKVEEKEEAKEIKEDVKEDVKEVVNKEASKSNPELIKELKKDFAEEKNEVKKEEQKEVQENKEEVKENVKVFKNNKLYNTLASYKSGEVANAATDEKKLNTLTGKARETYIHQRWLYGQVLKADSQEDMERNFKELMTYSLREKYREMYPELTDKDMEGLDIDQMAAKADISIMSPELPEEIIKAFHSNPENPAKKNIYDSIHNQANIDFDEEHAVEQCDYLLGKWMDQIEKSIDPKTKDMLGKLEELNKQKAEEKKNAKDVQKEEVKAVKEKSNDAPEVETKDITGYTPIKLALDIAQKMNIKGEKELIKAVDEGKITFGNGDERVKIDTKKGFKDIAEQIFNNVHDGKDVYINLPGKDKKPVENKLEIEYKGEKTMLNIKPVESKEAREKKAAEADKADRAKWKDVPEEQYQLLQKAVARLDHELTITGSERGASDEYKAFSGIIRKCNEEGIPRDPRQFNEVLNAIEDKAYDYFFAKLDQKRNATREKRFEASAMTLETISAIREGRKPSRINMQKNIIASQVLKANFKYRGESTLLNQEAENVLNSRSLFREKVDKFRNDYRFKEILEGKEYPKLKKIQKSLDKEMDKLIEGPQKEDRQKNRAAVKKSNYKPKADFGYVM